MTEMCLGSQKLNDAEIEGLIKGHRKLLTNTEEMIFKNL